jgi:hypothetical protein
VPVKPPSTARRAEPQHAGDSNYGRPSAARSGIGFESHRARPKTVVSVLLRRVTSERLYLEDSRASGKPTNSPDSVFVKSLNGTFRCPSVSILVDSCSHSYRDLRNLSTTDRPTLNEPEWGPSGPRRFVWYFCRPVGPPQARQRERTSEGAGG